MSDISLAKPFCMAIVEVLFFGLFEVLSNVENLLKFYLKILLSIIQMTFVRN